MQDGTYLKDSTGAWLPVVQSSGYYVAVRPLDGIDAELHPHEYLGVWTDTATGKVYLDATKHWDDLNLALFFAEAGGELAIWDIAADAEVLTSHGRKARELSA